MFAVCGFEQTVINAIKHTETARDQSDLKGYKVLLMSSVFLNSKVKNFNFKVNKCLNNY